jgi:hypothetical protein
MALGKKPTRGGRRPQVCRKDKPTRKLEGKHKKSKAHEKDVQARGLLISRNLPTKPIFFDLTVKPEITRPPYASSRFYRSLPVSAKAPAVRHTVADVEGELAPQSAAGGESAPSPKDVDVPDTACDAGRAGDFSLEKNDPDLGNSGAPSVATYVSAINGECQRGVDAFMNAARLCAEAAARLTTAQKRELIQALPFGGTAFSKYAQIGADIRLYGHDIQCLLPPHYTTTYAVTLLTDEELKRAIAEKVIYPDMKRNQLQRWLNRYREKIEAGPSSKEGDGDSAVASAPIAPTQERGTHSSTMSDDDNGDMQDESAAAPEDAPAMEAVATAAETKGPLTPPPGDDGIPAFLDRRPLSLEDQHAFDAIMAALTAASAVVRERVRAELMRETRSSRSATPPSSRGGDEDGAISNPPMENVVPAHTADEHVRPKRRSRKARGFRDDAPF